MNYYNVYFEIFGKRLKVRIKADNEDIAREIIQQDLDIHRIEQVYDLDSLHSDCIDVMIEIYAKPDKLN